MHRTSLYPARRRVVVAQHIGGRIEIAPEFWHTLERTRAPSARRPAMTTGPCTACHSVDRLAPTTDDCACLVCHDGGTAFLDANHCGVCGTPFTEDEPWGAPDGD